MGKPLVLTELPTDVLRIILQDVTDTRQSYVTKDRQSFATVASLLN